MAKADPSTFKTGDIVRHLLSGEVGKIKWLGETLDHNLFVDYKTCYRVAPRNQFELVRRARKRNEE